MKGGTSYLYSSVDLTSNLVGPTSLAVRADLSNWTLQIALHQEIYIASFGDFDKTKLISLRRNTILLGISSEVTII